MKANYDRGMKRPERAKPKALFVSRENARGDCEYWAGSSRPGAAERPGRFRVSNGILRGMIGAGEPHADIAVFKQNGWRGIPALVEASRGRLDDRFGIDVPRAGKRCCPRDADHVIGTIHSCEEQIKVAIGPQKNCLLYTSRCV